MQSSSDESDAYAATSSYVSEETFEVEGVVDERVECGQKVYRIRWKGFGPEGDTWEPEDNLSEGCAALLEEYARSKQKSAQRSAGSGTSDVFILGDTSKMPVKEEVRDSKSRSRSPILSPSNSAAATPVKSEIKNETDDSSAPVLSAVTQPSQPRKSAGGGGKSAQMISTSYLDSEMSRMAREAKQRGDSSSTMPVLRPETAEAASNEAPTETAEQQQPKKRRGRPRKNPLPETTQTSNKEDAASKEQESVQPKRRGRRKRKAVEADEDDAQRAVEGEDSAVETDDASTSSRHRGEKASESKTASASESNDDGNIRRRRRRTEVDNLYVADRVPDWTEHVLKEGFIGAEESASGKRVTRRIVQRVKELITPPTPSSPPPEPSQSAPRRRRRREQQEKEKQQEQNSTSTAENTDPTSRLESDEQQTSEKRDEVSSQSASATDNGVQDHAVAETPADDTSAKKGGSDESAVPPVLSERRQTTSPPVSQVPPTPPVAAQESRESAQTTAPNDHAGPQQPTQEPLPSRLRRLVSDATLPLSVSYGLDLNQEFKRRMKLYQLDKGQPVKQSAFERACLEGDLATVRNAVLALKNKQQPLTLDVNAYDRNGFSLLMRLCTTPCSAAHQHDDIIEYLVQAGANVNYRHQQTGQYALHLAVNANSLCKVKKLISVKAAVNVADRSGVTPLALAAQSNRQHIVFALLEFGADFNADCTPDRRNGSSRTALRAAEEAGHSSTAGVLLSHSRRVKEHFDTARSKVLIDVRVKREISPLHVYGLWESPEFHVFFPFEVTKLPNFRYGFVVVLALAQFVGQQVQVRLWGPSPFGTVLMNDDPLRCLQEDARFVFLTKLKTGMNCLKIKLDKSARESQMRMLVQVLLVQLNQLAPPRPPSMPLEAADKI